MKKIVIFVPGLVLVLFVGTFLFFRYERSRYQCDLAVMGSVQFADGIGRQTIGLIECLRKSCSIKHCKWGSFKLKDVPRVVQSILKKKYVNSVNVMIFEDPLSTSSAWTLPQFPEADVRIAYSMLECTKIPQNWVMILNIFFDAVVVPDSFLVDVYKNSGVRVPIFVLPLGMYLNSFLDQSFLHSKPVHRPFVFGNLSTICARKNQLTILKAFAKEFGNNPNFQLLINGREAEPEYLALIQETKCLLGLDNVNVTAMSISQREYLRVLKSLDCYVSASVGEGFSLQPREAMAYGLPSIVTDNTAQTTICLSGYVRAVPSPIPIKAEYFKWDDAFGNQFKCTVDDLAIALRDVYENYEFYAEKTYQGKTWVEQYKYEQLRKFYETLILPKEVVLSDRDEISEGILYTTSQKLKDNYGKIQRKQTFFRKIFNFFIVKFCQ